MIKYKNIILPIVAMLIIFGLDSLALTPLNKLSKIAGLLSGASGIAMLLIFYRQYPPQLRKFGAFYVALLVISILDSFLIYHQTLPDGIASNALILSSGSVFIIYYLLARFKVPMKDTVRYILGTTWVAFAIYLVLFASNYKYVNTTGDEFGFDTLRKGIVNIGALIYLVYFFEKNHIKYLAFSIILFSVNHWFDFQRFLFFAYLLCISFLLFTYRKNRTGVRFLAVMLFVIPLSIVGVSTTQFGQQFLQKYGAVISFVEENNEESDSSIDARVIESEIAWNSFKKYPVTGVGMIGGKMREQITSTSHFFVSDIGILGIMYVFGTLGLIFYFYQWRYFVQIYKRQYQSLHIYSVTILFTLIHSLITGRSILAPMELLLMITLFELARTRMSNDEIDG